MCVLKFTQLLWLWRWWSVYLDDCKFCCASFTFSSAQISVLVCTEFFFHISLNENLWMYMNNASLAFFVFFFRLIQPVDRIWMQNVRSWMPFEKRRQWCVCVQWREEIVWIFSSWLLILLLLLLLLFLLGGNWSLEIQACIHSIHQSTALPLEMLISIVIRPSSLDK